MCDCEKAVQDVPYDGNLDKVKKVMTGLQPWQKEAKDPWMYRSEGMKCKTCIWFVPKVAGNPLVSNSVYHLGRCRRHAPSMVGYPVVYVNDWCGDHRIDENKI